MFNALMAAMNAANKSAGNGDGEEPGGRKKFANEKEKTAYWMGLRKKYGDKWLAQRMQWLDWADQKLPTGGTPKELALKHAKKYGLDPEYILSSAMEEGIGNRWPAKDGYLYDQSEAYANANDKGELNGFGVDGFRSYGLDTIGDRLDALVKGGYLPAEFSKKMKTYKAYSEIEDKKRKAGLPATPITTAAFLDDDSAMEAKAAIMAQERDAFNKYIKTKGIKLSPRAEKFFMLAAYNGGAGKAQEILNDYQKMGLLEGDQFLNRAAGGQIYENIMPRLAGGEMFRGEGYFDEQPQPVEGADVEQMTAPPVAATDSKSALLNAVKNSKNKPGI